MSRLRSVLHNAGEGGFALLPGFGYTTRLSLTPGVDAV
jgi:hypothetical protein